jgi:hypothetical protein
LTALKILLGAAFVFLVSSAAGQLFFRLIKLRLRRTERAFLSFLAGAAILSNIVFALAVCGAFYTWVISAAGLAILAAWWLWGREPAAPDPPDQPDLSPAWQWLFRIPYLVFGVMYLVAAMAPEISADGGGGYHLGLVSRYYDHRGFFPYHDNMFGGFAAGIEMLFLAAFAFGRHSSAAVTHLLFLLTLPFGIMACCRRAGKPHAGVLAALLVFIAPVMGKDATCAYVDVATAAVAFGAFCCFEIWLEQKTSPALITLGLLAGFCYSAKMTAGVAVFFAFGGVIAESLAGRCPTRTVLKRTALLSAVALAVILPWLLRDIVLYQDPVFPFLNAWFPNRWQYPMIEDEWRRVMEHMSDVKLWQIPWQLTTGGKLAGIFGPVFLLTPLALLSARSRFGRHLLVGFVALSLTYFSNIGARLLIPAAPFLAVALAIGILSIPRAGKPLAVLVLAAHSLLSWPTFIGRWSHDYQWKIDAIDLSAALRITPEKQFLTYHWGDYSAGLLLDRFVPAGDLVFSPDMGQFAYHHRNLLGTFDSSRGRHVFLTFLTPFVPPLATTWVHDLKFAPGRFRKLRLVTSTKDNVDVRVSEIRFFKGDTEIPRSPNWRLSASDNPWEIQSAFDNDPISFWTSGRFVKPGIWLEADFGAPVEVDRIHIVQHADQHGVPLHPVANSDDLTFQDTGVEQPPATDLRMQVRDTLKNMGVRWLLIRDGNIAAPKFKTDAPAWGITEIADCPGFQLWRLD